MATTNLTMLEKSLNTKLVPAKTRKSDKQVVLRFGAGKPTLKVR